MKLIMASVLCLMAFACTASESGSDAQQYLNSQVAAWESQYEACKSQEKENGLPSQDVLDQLKEHDAKQLREFLNARSHMALERCTQAETAALNHAVLALVHDRKLPEAVREDARDVGSMIHSVSWFMHKTLQDLPEAMKNQFADTPYFEQPFDRFKVLDALNAL